MSDAQTLQNLDERTLAVHKVRWRTRPPSCDRKSLLWGLCPTYTVTYNIMEIRILKLIQNISCIFNNKLLLAVVS
jgi:hypothetical protein